MSYIVRNKSGYAKFVLNNSDALRVISKLNGEFDSVDIRGSKKTIFTVKDSGTLTYGDIALCFSADDYFISSDIKVK